MIKQLDVHQLAARLNAGEAFCLLDVRQAWEHQTAALPGSQLIPLNQLVNRAAEVSCPPGVPLVVYCHHGVRSLTGAQVLEQLGFSDVYSLTGGIDAWSVLIDPRVPRY